MAHGEKKKVLNTHIKIHLIQNSKLVMTVEICFIAKGVILSHTSTKKLLIFVYLGSVGVLYEL